MTMLRRAAAACAAVVLSLGAFGVLTACAPPASAPQQQPQPQQQQDNGDDAVPDGPADPAQATKIDGVAVSADGPSPGNLFISLNDDGSWCKGATLFWSPTVADGVFFTIEKISGAGLHIASGDCGDLPQCLGQDLPSNEQLECSIRMQASNDFEEVTPLAMTGSITCPTAAVCDEVRGRVADAQEQLWMCSPTWIEAGNPCERPTDGS